MMKSITCSSVSSTGAAVAAPFELSAAAAAARFAGVSVALVTVDLQLLKDELIPLHVDFAVLHVVRAVLRELHHVPAVNHRVEHAGVGELRVRRQVVARAVR